MDRGMRNEGKRERERALCSSTILKNILRILNIVQVTYSTTDVVSNNANIKAVNANEKNSSVKVTLVASQKCDTVSQTPTCTDYQDLMETSSIRF